MLDWAWVARHDPHSVSNAIFDPLGNDDFALASQKRHGTHFAHIHAYRIHCFAVSIRYREERLFWQFIIGLPFDLLAIFGCCL